MQDAIINLKEVFQPTLAFYVFLLVYMLKAGAALQPRPNNNNTTMHGNSTGGISYETGMLLTTTLPVAPLILCMLLALNRLEYACREMLFVYLFSRGIIVTFVDKTPGMIATLKRSFLAKACVFVFCLVVTAGMTAYHRIDWCVLCVLKFFCDRVCKKRNLRINVCARIVDICSFPARRALILAALPQTLAYISYLTDTHDELARRLPTLDEATVKVAKIRAAAAASGSPASPWVPDTFDFLRSALIITDMELRWLAMNFTVDILKFWGHKEHTAVAQKIIRDLKMPVEAKLAALSKYATDNGLNTELTYDVVKRIMDGIRASRVSMEMCRCTASCGVTHVVPVNAEG